MAKIWHACLVAQSSPTLCPLNWSPPGSPVHRILQARILEWVAISYSRGSSQPRDQMRVCCISSIGRWILLSLSHLGSPFKTWHSSSLLLLAYFYFVVNIVLTIYAFKFLRRKASSLLSITIIQVYIRRKLIYEIIWSIIITPFWEVSQCCEIHRYYVLWLCEFEYNAVRMFPILFNILILVMTLISTLRFMRLSFLH